MMKPERPIETTVEEKGWSKPCLVRDWGTWGNVLANVKDDGQYVSRAGWSTISELHSHENRSRRDSWDNGANWEKALELADTGWRDGREKMAEIRDGIVESVSREMRGYETAWDVCGNAVDVATYLSGAPECFLAFVPAVQPGTEIIRMMVSWGMSCSVPASNVLMRGAAVLAAIDLLESVGKRVEVTAMTAVSGNFGDRAIDLFAVKEADDHLEIDRMAYILAHAGCYRRIGFAVKELWPVRVRKNTNVTPCGNYGRPIEAPKPIREQYGLYLPTVSAYEPEWRNAENATGWVKQILRSQGVELSESAC